MWTNLEGQKSSQDALYGVFPGGAWLDGGGLQQLKEAMTIDQITKEVSGTKPVSRRQVLRYLHELEIRPLGRRLRSRPQVYPDDAAARILEELGLKVVTMPQLRRERSRARKARAA